MATLGFLFTSLLLLAYLVSVSKAAIQKCNCSSNINRFTFKEDFVWGTASAAYQYEGAYNIDGKGQSNWDYYTATYPEKIAEQANGDIALDSYHRYQEDVCISKDLGVDAYRFSISWSRILPYGTLHGAPVNFKGIEYYNHLIDLLITNGIEPYVTIFHWDLPQALEEAYGGFLNESIVEDYSYYAETCFKYFGDRVKNWITFNEPWSFSVGGYANGLYAPGRCSSWQGCPTGDSATEPYIVTHHQLLAHAAAVEIYRTKYQPFQLGSIGITLVSQWYDPYDNTQESLDAQQRGLDFMLGWFLGPITYGEYPASMQEAVKDRLPTFNSTQKSSLTKSFDFLGINYYTGVYAINQPNLGDGKISYLYDSKVNTTSECNGVPIGDQSGASWLYIFPLGLKNLMNYIKTNYEDPRIIITENGVCEKNDPSLTLFEALNDTVRKDYMYEHLCCLEQSIEEDQVSIFGYLAWSLLDNFEWISGYTERFGLHFVDYNTLARYPKYSAIWLKSILATNVTYPNSPPSGNTKNIPRRYPRSRTAKNIRRINPPSRIAKNVPLSRATRIADM